MCTCVYMYVCICLCACVPVGMEQGGTLQGLLQPVSLWTGGRQADRLSWRETGQLSGRTRMDSVGSGVVDGMAGRE